MQLATDAMARRTNGEFNLYGALSGWKDGKPWSQLYSNPTQDKYAFISVMQILSAVSKATMTAVISESWFIDFSQKDEDEAEKIRKECKELEYRISKHPDAGEVITIAIENDEETLNVMIPLPLGSGDLTCVSSKDDDVSTEGAMMGMRPSLEMRIKAMNLPQVKARDIMAELEMDWYLGTEEKN